MSTKSNRNRENRAAESHLLDHDPVEQRALQIARDEGREAISQDDRLRAKEELLAPNESGAEPEAAPGVDVDLTVWDETADTSGTRAKRVAPEDEKSVGKELAEKGLRGPKETRSAGDRPA